MCCQQIKNRSAKKKKKKKKNKKHEGSWSCKTNSLFQGAVGGQWSLTWCFADFEPGLRSALAIVAPGVLTLGDSWHFFHDNHKWVRANGGQEYPFLQFFQKFKI
jgi:hypothetical protein